MQVKTLITALQTLPPDSEIVTTSMDDYFSCDDFEVHSPYDDGQTQEIVMNAHVKTSPSD